MIAPRLIVLTRFRSPTGWCLACSLLCAILTGCAPRNVTFTVKQLKVNSSENTITVLLSDQGGCDGTITEYIRTANSNTLLGTATGGDTGESYNRFKTSDLSSIQFFVFEGQEFQLDPGDEKSIVEFVGPEGEQCVFVVEFILSKESEGS